MRVVRGGPAARRHATGRLSGRPFFLNGTTKACSSLDQIPLEDVGLDAEQSFLERQGNTLETGRGRTITHVISGGHGSFGARAHKAAES
jgi:hypothetical protein